MNFGVITLNQNIETEQNYITWILTALLAIHIKTEDFCEDIAHDVEKQFVISNYDEHDKRPLPIGKSN